MTYQQDPVIIKREKISRLVKFGIYAGSLLYLVATILVIYGTYNNFSTSIEYTIILCLILGSVLLAPAIVFYYAIKAAIRADERDEW